MGSASTDFYGPRPHSNPSWPPPCPHQVQGGVNEQIFASPCLENLSTTQELQRLENNDEEESVPINRAWVCQICPDIVEYNGASDPKCDGNEKINRCKCILICPSSANRLSANKCNTECDLFSKSSLCLLAWLVWLLLSVKDGHSTDFYRGYLCPLGTDNPRPSHFLLRSQNVGFEPCFAKVCSDPPLC